MIKMKLIDSDANNKSISNQMETSNKNDTKMQENSGYKTIKVNLEDQTRTIHVSKSNPKSGYKAIKVNLQGKTRHHIPYYPRNHISKSSNHVLSTTYY